MAAGRFKPTTPPEKVATHKDAGKVRLDLLPFIALYKEAEVMTFGCEKYAEHNWRQGIAYMKLIGSALRHIFKWSMGQNTDDESGLHHLAHARANLGMLIEQEALGIGEDNRWEGFTDVPVLLEQLSIKYIP